MKKEDNYKKQNFGNPKKHKVQSIRDTVEKSNNLIPGLYRSTTHYDSSSKINTIIYSNNDLSNMLP